MTQYQRITGKVFGGKATATGNDPQIAQFGSALAKNFVGTTDPETIQSLPAWSQGWIGAVTPETQFPPLPEMTGAMKVLSHQICGILQQGVSTWDSGTIYYTGNFVSLNGRLFISQTDENQGNNPATDTINWQEFSSGGGLEIGDIGIAPLGIDETKGKRRYLNGQIIVQDQYTVFSEKVKNAITLYPSLACTESEWQTTATITVGGQVGKFVVDDEGGTIRLPKIIMPIQGLTNLANLAEIVEAGLPNITGVISYMGRTSNTENIGVSGAFYDNGDGTGLVGTSSASRSNVAFNASRSSSIYGNSTTVQQEQIQYPYFIQVATGAETEDNIINEIELNNPYTLFDSKYSPNALYNASWLKSEGQYNSGAVYVTCYEGLLVEYNTDIEVGTTTTLPSGTEYTKKGLSVALSTEEYTDYDFVLNTADETFRLPLLNGSENLIDTSKYIDYPVNQELNTAPANGYVFVATDTGVADNNVGIVVIDTNDNQVYMQRWQANTPGMDQGLLVPITKGFKFGFNYTTVRETPYYRFYYNKGNGSLYFYVGETVQNANIINVGRIEEKIVDLIPDNNTVWDGQWVVTPYTAIVENVTLGANADRIVDLSNYLPNDGYFYQINASISHVSGAQGSASVSYQDNTGNTLDTISVRSQVSNQRVTTSGFAIVGADRQIHCVSGAVSVTQFYLILRGYRRLGTNQ